MICYGYNRWGGRKGYFVKRNGFTIVELLIVIVVIAILAAVTIVSYNGVAASAHDSSVKSDLRQVSSKLQQFYIDNNVYPTTAGQLQSMSLGVAKNSYGMHGVNSSLEYNFLYCRPQSDPTKYALLASSKGGTLFQVVDGALTVAPPSIRTLWTNGSVSSATICTNVGIPTASAQVWFYQGSVWAAYLTGS